jgi:hypothetical protein
MTQTEGCSLNVTHGARKSFLTIVLDIDETLASHQMVRQASTTNRIWSSSVPTSRRTTGNGIARPQKAANVGSSPSVLEDKVFVLRPHALSLFQYLHTLTESEAVDVIFWTNSNRSHSQWLLSLLSREWENAGRPSYPHPVACKRSAVNAKSDLSFQSTSPSSGSMFSKAIFADDFNGSLGSGVKRLSRLGVDVERTILIENSAANVADEERGSAIIVPDFEWNAPPPCTLKQLVSSSGDDGGKPQTKPGCDDALLVVMDCLKRIVSRLEETSQASVSQTLEQYVVGEHPSTKQRLHRSPTGSFVVK